MGRLIEVGRIVPALKGTCLPEHGWVSATGSVPAATHPDLTASLERK